MPVAGIPTPGAAPNQQGTVGAIALHFRDHHGHNACLLDSLSDAQSFVAQTSMVTSMEDSPLTYTDRIKQLNDIDQVLFG